MGKVAKYSHFRPHTTVHHPPTTTYQISKTTYHPRYRQYPFHVLTSFSLDLIELVIKGHDHASFCSIISIYRGNRTLSRYNRTEFGSIDRVDSEKWIRRWGLKAKSWRGMFPFRRWLMWNDFFLRVKFLSFPPCLFLPLYKCYQHNNINREIEVLKIILDLNILLIYLVRVVKFFMHRKLFINYNKLNIFYLFNVMLCLKKIIDKKNNRMIIREKL